MEPFCQNIYPFHFLQQKWYKTNWDHRQFRNLTNHHKNKIVTSISHKKKQDKHKMDSGQLIYHSNFVNIFLNKYLGKTFFGKKNNKHLDRQKMKQNFESKNNLFHKMILGQKIKKRLEYS